MARLGEVRFHVADVAGVVGPSAEELGTQAEIQSQILRGFPVVLNKHGGVLLPVIVVIDTAPAKAEFRAALQKIRKIGDAGIAKVKLSVKDLRELLIETDRCELATKPPVVFPSDPSQSLYEIEVVLRLVLIGLRRRTELKP